MWCWESISYISINEILLIEPGLLFAQKETEIYTAKTNRKFSTWETVGVQVVRCSISVQFELPHYTLCTCDGERWTTHRFIYNFYVDFDSFNPINTLWPLESMIWICRELLLWSKCLYSISIGDHHLISDRPTDDRLI